MDKEREAEENKRMDEMSTKKHRQIGRNDKPLPIKFESIRLSHHLARLRISKHYGKESVPKTNSGKPKQKQDVTTEEKTNVYAGAI